MRGKIYQSRLDEYGPWGEELRIRRQLNGLYERSLRKKKKKLEEFLDGIDSFHRVGESDKEYRERTTSWSDEKLPEKSTRRVLAEIGGSAGVVFGIPATTSVITGNPIATYTSFLGSIMAVYTAFQYTKVERAKRTIKNRLKKEIETLEKKHEYNRNWIEKHS